METNNTFPLSINCKKPSIINNFLKTKYNLKNKIIKLRFLAKYIIFLS